MKVVIRDLEYIEGESVLSGIKKFKRRYYAKLATDSQEFKTSVSSNPRCEETISLDASDSSDLKIEVFFKHQLRDDTFEGQIQESVKSLLEDQDVVRNLSKKNSKGNKVETLRLKVKFTITVEGLTAEGPDEQSQLKELVSKATRDLEVMKTVPWESVLTKLRKFHNIAIGISGIHPYAKLALSIFVAVSQASFTGTH